MRRRLALFLSALVTAGTLVVLAPAQPASAVSVCAGIGTATTSPVYYPPFGSTGQKTFTFSFVGGIGICAHVPSGGTGKILTAAGTFLGYCGLSSGNGTTTASNSDLFSWIAVGGIMILTGHLVGVAYATPNIPQGESCKPTGTGALDFIVSGAIVLLNCPPDLAPFGFLDTSTLVTVPLPFIDLPNFTFPVVNIESQELHIWTNGPCIPNVLTL